MEFDLDDGAVRVWRNYPDNDEGRLSLVTAWTALSGMIAPYKGKFPLEKVLKVRLLREMLG